GAHGREPSAARATRYPETGANNTALSSAYSRRSCTPAARSTRTPNVHERQPLAWQRASPFFCKQVLQCCVVEHGIGQKLLQLGVFALQPPQALGLGELQPAELGFPVVETCLADPVLAAQVGRFHAGLVLL